MLGKNNGNIVVNTGKIQGDIVQSQGIEKKAETETLPQMDESQYRYDVALSYAGEQVKIVSRVAKILESEGLKVFFAPKRESEFAAEDMIVRFYQIYRYKSRYVAAFVTEEYVKKDITMFEATTAILRGRENGRYRLIPIYFEKASLPHLNSDINYIRADELREVEIAEKIKNIIQAEIF